MPNINEIIDEDSINPVDLHCTQHFHSNSDQHQTQQQQHQQAPNNGVTKNKKLFPKKLWDLINDDKYNFCLRWSDDGQLVYLNRDDFEDSYLKTAENQFHTQKAISFVRQMNMYGFRKVDDCFYENDNFKRDSEHLLKNMIRKHPNKNQNNDDISSSSSFNNLYSRNNVSTNSRITTPSTATSPTSLLQQTANVSLLAPPNSIDPSFPSHLAYPIYSGPQLYDSRDGILANQHQRLTINEDSLSSSGDYCCSAGSSQNDTLTSVLDRIDNSTNQQFNDLQNGLSEVENNANMTKRRAAQPNLHAHHAFLNPFHFSQGNSPVGEGSGQNLMAANQYHNNQFVNFPSFNMNFNMMNVKPLMATPSSSPSHNENNCDGFNQQQNDLQSLYPNQREIIKALMAQQQQQQSQNNAHLLGDLTATLPPSQPNFQPDHNNLGAFYSLLASINSNLYSPADHILQGNQQNLAFDVNRFPNLQQLYQNLLVQQEYLVSNEACQNSQTPRRSESAGFQSSAPNGTDSIVTSSLIQDKSTSNAIKQENISIVIENGSKDGPKPSEKINDKNNGKLSSEADSSLKRRDNKANRSFKRSADSILDSHNNHGSEKVNGFKKIIIEHENARNNDNNDKFVNKYAKNLVAQIALAKAARVDSDVIAEASRYTERFVETLFDTAQVIARHSNGSGSSDPLSENRPTAEDKESNDEREMEHRNINLSDITSAFKLLPSKLPKILK